MAMLPAFPKAIHHRLVRHVLIALCALPAVVAPAAAADPVVAADTVITLQRGGCEKRCAVYKVIVFADGTVIYDGQYYVRKTGVVRDKVAGEQVRKLVDDFQAAGFFDLKDDYGEATKERCAEIRSDGPLAIMTVVSGGRSKSVTHDHRCLGPGPSQLRDLEDRIDKLANTVRWIK
jgi:hypothetical protein